MGLLITRCEVISTAPDSYPSPSWEDKVADERRYFLTVYCFIDCSCVLRVYVTASLHDCIEPFIEALIRADDLNELRVLRVL